MRHGTRIRTLQQEIQFVSRETALPVQRIKLHVVIINACT